MALNTSKTQFIIFDGKMHNIDIFLNKGRQIQCDRAKYLGITIDRKMDFRYQFDTLIQKLKRFVPIFYAIRDKLNKECKYTLYNCLVRSKIEYGIEQYGNTYDIHIKKLQTLQKKS